MSKYNSPPPNRSNKLRKSYISEFVYGGIDGAITTFAVVSGAAGAKAELHWVLIFGFANLIADGFSMSVGNYLSAKTAWEEYDRLRAREYWEVENLTKEEVEEIRTIYKEKGLDGELLDEIVKVITSDKEVWIDTMMKEEIGVFRDQKTPLSKALATFFSFISIGLIPLLAYLISLFIPISAGLLFPLSCLATTFALGIVGTIKSKIKQKSRWKGILETLLLGGIAALIAYAVGGILANNLKVI